jgi:RNA polymerase sigma-70 factor (ECF subfamily)
VFEQIFREYYPQLCRYIYRYTADVNQSEEVVQDFFCKLWDKHYEIEISSSFGGYLFKAVTNHFLNYIRRQRKERLLFKQADDNHDETGFTTQDTDSELAEKYSLAILQLPEKRREIFEMSRFEGMKYQEIADKLEINIKTVETQMTRSLEFLRKYLKEFISVIVLIISIIQKL